MSARALPLCLLLALPLASVPAAAQDPPDALVPEYELTVANGARLRSLFRENAWTKEFTASNLSRGVLVRLGPVLTAVARDGQDGWKGRLVDFVADRFLDERPVKVSYFHAGGLVSPFGLTFPELTPRERDAVHLVLKGLRSGPDVPREVADGEGGAVSVAVVPLALRLQRFAAVETGTCLAVSRDPRVAATLSRSCALDTRLAAATLDVRTDEFFSAWSAVLEKLFGVGPHLRVTFDWDKKHARFTPSAAALQLARTHALGTAPLDASLLAAIPADAPFLATAVLPDPGRFDAASAEEYFRTAPDKRAPGAFVPVTLVSLGMRAGDGERSGRGEAMSVLLIPRVGAGEKAVADLDALFNRRGTYEVHASRACPGVVALSPSKAALERVADACSGRRPSFRQAPPKIVAALTGAPVSTAAFLNVGGFLKSSLLWGWQREAPPPKGKGPAEPPPPPRELVEAMQLLDRLPMYAFSGRAAGDAVVMTGVEP